jgi:hypothetical protein
VGTGVGVATPADEEVILTSWGPNGPGDAEEDAAAIELDRRSDTGEDDATDIGPTSAAEGAAEEETTIELEEAVGIIFEVIGVMDELDPASAAETASVAVVDTTGSDRTSAAETGETEVSSVEGVPVVTVSEDTTELD